ncbi:MAG TPA: tetratricopeptide repeat protein [Vicinamibacterales bacterium]|nr:tetratricopeptide repeat protein [Vicinamibacterales bacterium]
MTGALKRRGAIVIALLLAAVTVCAWIVWRSSPATPAASLGLTLLVNHRPHLEVTPGTPLYFEVSITSSRSAGSITIGSRWRPWHRLVRLEASALTGMPWALTSAGPPRAMSITRSGDERPEVVVTPDPPAVAHLEAGRQVYTVTQVASPEAMANVRPGAYRIRAVLETPSWMLWGWRGRKVSQPVTIVVRDASQAGGTRAALETQRLGRVADFYIATERFADAEKTARQLLALEPDQANAHVLLGDALLGLKRREEALATYRRAMVLLRPSYEEPSLLMDRIQRAVDAARR